MKKRVLTLRATICYEQGVAGLNKKVVYDIFKR